MPGALPDRAPLRLLLDEEPQRPGEDEVATALSLLTRVLELQIFSARLIATELYAEAGRILFGLPP